MNENRHVRALSRQRLGVATIEDPLDHANVVAEARPHELAGGILFGLGSETVPSMSDRQKPQCQNGGELSL